MFGEIAPTALDLRFRVFGIPVRVHPIFWATSAFLAWNSAQGDPRVLFLCVLAIFVSIMVHELGHALMNKLFGFDSEIVLYFFGGYATSMRHSTWKDIAVSAAGPFSGFLLLFVLFVVPIPLMLLGWLPKELDRNGLFIAVWEFAIFINLVWNVINLVPVLPLDGGQIARELFLWANPRRGLEYALLVSMIAGGGVVALSIKSISAGTGVLGLEPRFLAVMFFFLTIQSFQAYSAARGGGYR